MTTPAKQSTRILLKKFAAIVLALSGMLFILWLDSWFTLHAELPKFGADMNDGLLLMVGFLTSFHCVGMCGSLVLSYTAKSAMAKQKPHLTHFLYGAGKTVSYTVIGALLGEFGAIISFTPHAQGVAGVAAGIFLILFGLHMLEVFPALNHFQIRTPGFLMRFIGKEYRKHSHPFIIGLLNGLMIICGPLQAMYVMAAGSGGWREGAEILFFFGLGTLPLLLGFGFLTSLLSANLTPKLLKVSGGVVMALGGVMLNRGLAVTGSGLDFNSLQAELTARLLPIVTAPSQPPAEQSINMDVIPGRFAPNQFVLQKDIPVRWSINGKELNTCNRVILVPKYGLRIELHSGVQIVEFTPHETGIVPWSCWMGMIPGSFIVVDKPPSDAAASKAAESCLRHWLDEWQTAWRGALASLSENWRRCREAAQ